MGVMGLFLEANGDVLGKQDCGTCGGSVRVKPLMGVAAREVTGYQYSSHASGCFVRGFLGFFFFCCFSCLSV